LSSTPLLEEPMVVALPEVHALAQGDGSAALSMRRLAGETFILFGLTGSGPRISVAAGVTTSSSVPVTLGTSSTFG